MGELSEVVASLTKAALAMPKLRKDDRNAHGGYNYVSVDDFYDQVASVAHGEGLFWSISEQEFEIATVNGKDIYQAKFSVTLLHVNGYKFPEFFSCTILHPMQGAQTAGSALSYAAKMFLRNTFAIVTGEADADTTDGNAFDPSPPPPTPVKRPVAPAPSAPSVSDAAIPINAGLPEEIAALKFACEAAAAFLPNAASLPELLKYWTDNEATFKRIKKWDGDRFKAIAALFADRKRELEPA